MREELKMISVKDIEPHPDNPRKEIGDIEELTESIRKNGIMQNLTVIPGRYLEKQEYIRMCAAEGIKKPDAEISYSKDNAYFPDPDKYTVLIGHRRLAAAKAAGLETVPARVIENMEYKEQVGIMLEENMQRTDLTVTEQAFGFQMMLDLGDTPKQIAEKTGFSEQTVKHRLEIAKLDKRLLKKQDDEKNEFQLTISDYITMEKIKDLKERNHIFRTAKDSNDLKYKVDLYLLIETRKRNFNIYIEKFKAQGIREATQKESDDRYRNWILHETYDLGKEPKDGFKVPGIKTGDTVVWMPVSDNFRYNSTVYLYKKSRKESGRGKDETGD